MYTITEVCKKTELSSRTLRVWEDEGLLVARRDAGGTRVFDDPVLDRIEKILALKEFGLSLKDIREVLEGKNPAASRELLQQKSAEIDETFVHLVTARQRLEHIRALLDLGRGKSSLVDLVADPKEIVGALQSQLLTTADLATTTLHHEYLAAEVDSTDPEKFLAWVSCLRILKQCANECGVSTRFVRGPSTGSLALRLCGWTHIDPVVENLVPRAPDLSWKDFHFDVPCSCAPTFFDKLKQVNAGQHQFKLTAFRSPILDILARFAGSTDLTLIPIDPEDSLVGRLREGDCAYVFGLDESGPCLISRLFPDMPNEELSPARVGEDLRRLAPRTRNDVLRFIALRREKTLPIFAAFVDGTYTEPEKSAIVKHLPPENRGAAIFHEDLTHAIRQLTGWSLVRADVFRRLLAKSSAAKQRVANTDIEEFVQKSDQASLRYLEKWAPLSFSKAHLVAWWYRTALTLSCKMRDEKGWIAAVKDWEKESDLAWNDIGVVSGEVKILTPP